MSRSTPIRRWITAAAVAAALSASSLAGQSLPERPASSEEREFPATGEHSRLGADTCITCHSPGAGQFATPDATPIFATPHAARMDPSAPFADLQCESCHGPGKDHARSQRGGGSVGPAITFGVRAQTPPAEQNAVCLTCHESHGRLAWFNSTHEAEDVPCAACHQVHSERDPVFDPLAQQQACFTCHLEREADTFRSSNHPLRFGQMACSDCHDPHAGNNDFLLREATVNETCYTCHAEKRGPFLWEHAPASEDCSLCHRPHGSNHDAL
ncbi:MAG: DmsE family decaheme c-type cytochrome, partial [Xanthomonadales bacterium]|nr:DmsE family decaheme c-type cytochrome [Xanthomonadales bacterium]